MAASNNIRRGSKRHAENAQKATAISKHANSVARQAIAEMKWQYQHLATAVINGGIELA
jgi:hypothetical protein